MSSSSFGLFYSLFFYNLMRPTPANDLELNRIFLSGLGSDTFYQIQIQIRFWIFYQIQIQIRFQIFYQIQIHFQIFFRYRYSTAPFERASLWETYPLERPQFLWPIVFPPISTPYVTPFLIPSLRPENYAQWGWFTSYERPSSLPEQAVQSVPLTPQA